MRIKFPTIAALALAALACLPAQGKADTDPLHRLVVNVATKNAQVGAGWNAVTFHGLDLTALVVTSKGDTKKNEFASQRHYHPAIGAYIDLAHTNLQFGVYSVLDGNKFRRLGYGVSIKL